MLSIDKTRDFYDKFASLYEKNLNRFYFERKLEIVSRIKCSRVLDVGCGTGKYLRRIDAHERYGVDISRQMIEIGKKKAKDIVLKVANAEKLPFKENYFDFVFSLDMLEHTPNPESAISEMHRVLKNGGTMIVTTPNPKFHFILKIIESLGLKFPEGPHEYIAKEDIQKWLYGFSSVKIYRILFGGILVAEAKK